MGRKDEQLLKTARKQISRDRLQNDLELKGIKINGGICNSYNICEYCKAKGNSRTDSKTPCADALLDMEKTLDKPVELKTNGKKRILDTDI
jgi:hypothetical protein